jgi:hypothetical protein
MKYLPILPLLLTTIAKLLGPGCAKAVVADSLLMNQKLLVINRSRRRAPQSIGTRSIPVGLLVIVSRSMSHPASCRNFPAFNAVEIS